MTDVSQSWNRTRCLPLLCTCARQVWFCTRCPGSSSVPAVPMALLPCPLCATSRLPAWLNRNLTELCWGSEPSPLRTQDLHRDRGVKVPACVLCHLPPSEMASNASSGCLLGGTFQVLHCRTAKPGSLGHALLSSHAQKALRAQSAGDDCDQQKLSVRIRRNLKSSRRMCFGRSQAQQQGCTIYCSAVHELKAIERQRVNKPQPSWICLM